MTTLFICIKIFFARILDVTISTFRQNVMLKGHVFIGFFLAFFEILIWFYVAREALLIEIDSLFIPISYSLGYATGTFIGTFLSQRFINGNVGVQIIIDEDKEELLKALKLRGYSFNIMNIKSGYNNKAKILLFLEVSRKSYNKLEKLITKYDKNAFIVVSDTKKVCNGIVK